MNVSASVTDLQPAIQMSKGTAFDNSVSEGYYTPVYYIENFGWAPAKDAKLQLTFGKPMSPADKKSTKRTLNLGTIQKSVKIDFEQALHSAGVDVSALKKNGDEGFRCRSRGRSACLREIKAKGLFGSLVDYVSLDETNIVVGVSGELVYAWDNNLGKANSVSSPFKIQLPIGVLKSEAEAGEGGSREIISKATQQLKLDASNYRIPISYTTNVAAGRTSRLVLPLEAAKSSSHDFTIVVQLVDGQEIKSRPINLLYYRPRWFGVSISTPTGADADSSFLDNYDLVGSEIRQIRNSDDASCNSACKSELRCRAYTYDRLNGQCSLKSAVTAARLDPDYQSTLKEGTPRPKNSNDDKVVVRNPNMSFNGGDGGYGYLIRQDSDIDACDKLCAGDDRCIAFTFKKTARNCYLFDAAFERVSATDSDSGLKKQSAR